MGGNMPLKKGAIHYLAGIIDGEGCFNIGKCRTSYIPRILVVNTNKKLIKWLKRNFGGDINYSTVKNKINWKGRYTWRICHKKALKLADRIYNYLQVKDKQALVFRTWLAIQDVFKKFDRKEGYEYLISQLTLLNKKGVNNAFD
jgi:hypothetical protein